MSTDTVNQVVDRLIQAGPLSTERFAALLGAPLTPDEANPFWHSFTFELAQGPFARGEVRLNTTGDGALVILEPRDPPGLGEADVDRAALGPMLGARPNPRIPPEGAETEYFLKDGVQVALQWTSSSRRLLNLVLEWKPAAAAGSEATAASQSQPNPAGAISLN